MDIVILTNSYLRHKAFVKRLQKSNKINLKGVFYEKNHPFKLISSNNNDCIKTRHLDARDVSEQDTFGWFLNFNDKKIVKEELSVNRGWFSTNEALKKIKNLQPDLIIVYGTSIIKGPILEIFHNRIINIHLGLSPYYRGSGTNYFPFVNNEPQYCGASFLLMDDGVDTGKIIHQIRPEIYLFDSFHQLSNRFLLKTFNVAVQLIEQFKDLEFVDLKDEFFSDKTRKVYKIKDFTEDSLNKLENNFSKGLIKNYLSNKNSLDSKTPIFSQTTL